MRIIITFIAFLNLFVSSLFAQKEYTFDLSKIGKKAFHAGGYFEFRPVLFGLDHDSSFYQLKFYNREQGKTTAEYNLKALLDFGYEKGIFRAKIRTNTDVIKTFSGWSHKINFYEAFISLHPSLSFRIDIGKKRLKWGKGYAWNPVAFLDRPKNPNDPDLALEGYTVLSIDYIMSFQGKLRTITLTPVLFPVNDHINSNFGKRNKLNFGGKIYFLFYDTDIDLMFLSDGSVPSRYGLDFSRNIIPNFEIHGEFAHIPDYKKRILREDGNVDEVVYASTNYLLGVRFLTKTNTTIFFEYLKNESGYDLNEMKGFYYLISQSLRSYLLTGNDSGLKFLAGAEGQGYRTFAPMQDYLYLRIVQKDAWDIPYFSPSLTSIFNLADQSLSIAPELLYNPITNLEFRAKLTVLFGKQNSEFGEKQNDLRMEFRGRYYF